MSGRRLYAVECDADSCPLILVAEGYSETVAKAEADGWYVAGSSRQAKTTYCPDHKHLRPYHSQIRRGPVHCGQCGHGPLVAWNSKGVPLKDRHRKGLCGTCAYQLLDKQGRVKKAAPARRSSASVLEDWEYLRSWGYTKELAAARLGMTFEAFERAIHRAKEKVA